MALLQRILPQILQPTTTSQDAQSAIFDFQRQPMAGQPTPQMKGGMAIGQKPTQGGGIMQRLGGAFGGQNFPRSMSIIGAMLRDLDTGGNSLQEVTQMLEEQKRFAAENAWQNEQRGRMRTSWGREDQQIAARDQYIGGLSPEQQRIARVAPDVAIEQGARTAFARPEQVIEGGFIWTKNPDGTLTRGEAVPLNEAQRADYRIAQANAARAGDGRGEIVDARMFSQGQGLADDFRQQVKPYQDFADTGRLVTSYSRTLQSGQRDPNMESAILMRVVGALQSGVLSDSDVRQGSAQTLPTSVEALVNYAQGKGRLSAQQVQGLIRVGQRMDQIARARVQGYYDNVQGIATARGIPSQYVFGVDPMTTMFGETTEAAPDDTPDLIRRLEELERLRAGGGPARRATSGQPGGYTGR